jgi:uncharacterized integral membrane protein
MTDDGAGQRESPAPGVIPFISHFEGSAARSKKRANAHPAVAVSVLESSGSRVARRVRRIRLYLSAFSAVAVLAYVAVFAASNNHRVRVDWVLGKSSVSLIWLVVVVAILGSLSGLLLAAALRWRTRAPRRREGRHASSK